MTDRRQIVALWKRGKAAALVTLVRVEGSSYRRVGARLLIAADGETAGSISGGCLEAEVIRKAQWLTREGRAVVERYSTLFDDTADIPYGLGCGGTVHLLLEPADTPEFTALMQALERSLEGQTLQVITRLPTAETPLRRTISSGGAYETPRDDTFEETLEPPQNLFLFGAGNDAQPMARLAGLMGWNITVVDSRAQWARAERFPETFRVVLALDPAEITARDAVVLMTHSYEQDRAHLTAVLPRAPRYLGLLGARHRSALLLSEAAAALSWPLERVCESVFAPLGLDLGGDGPEAIALATIAEIQACCESAAFTRRRLAADAVAEMLTQGDASRYLQLQCSQ